MNQGLAFPPAEAATRLDAAELMARNAVWRQDGGLSRGKEADMTKWLCADAGYRAADQAVQTHGGMGYAQEYHVERYFREARLLRLAPVGQEMVLSHVSRHVPGLPRSYCPRRPGPESRRVSVGERSAASGHGEMTSRREQLRSGNAPPGTVERTVARSRIAGRQWWDEGRADESPLCTHRKGASR